MPTVKLNRDVLEKLVGKKLKTDELKDRISMLGTDLEGIEGNEITVEVFPNRPDMLSEQGFARAFSSFIGVKTGLRNYPVKKGGGKVIIERSVSKVRPFTACAIVKNLSFDDEKIREVIQIQEKLHITYGRNRKKAAIGIYPLEHIKLPITFKAMKPKEIRFKPLESATEMDGLQVLRKHPAGRDYAHLLEGCDIFPIFVDATGAVLSMPPIINSDKTGRITSKTTEVFVECSGFDFLTLSTCLNIIVTSLADMGGDVYSMELNYPDGTRRTPDLSPMEMTFDHAHANRLLGLDLNLKKTTELLERMGFSYKNGKVSVPAYRADVIHPTDLIEDIAIAYGYENFDAEIPKVATVGKEDPFAVFKKKVSNILVGHGLIETHTYHLTNKEDNNFKMLVDMDMVNLANALTPDYNALRSWMLPSLFKVLNDNRSNEYPQNIFESGRVFSLDPKTESGTREFERLALLICDPTADFTKAKQLFDSLMRALDVAYETKQEDHPSFIAGRSSRVSVDGQGVAYIGEFHPQVLENWQLEMPVTGFELNLTDLFRLSNQ